MISEFAHRTSQGLLYKVSTVFLISKSIFILILLNISSYWNALLIKLQKLISKVLFVSRLAILTCTSVIFYIHTKTEKKDSIHQKWVIQIGQKLVDQGGHKPGKLGNIRGFQNTGNIREIWANLGKIFILIPITRHDCRHELELTLFWHLSSYSILDYDI